MTTAEQSELPRDEPDTPTLARAADGHLRETDGHLARVKRLLARDSVDPDALADEVMCARESLREGRQGVVGIVEVSE